MSNSSADTLERKGKVSKIISAGKKIVHFMNPVSGSSRYYASTRKAVDELGGQIVVSEHSGQITELIMDALEKDPATHAVVYGGDGTVFEAVNGIMLSGAAETATLSVIPSGSGNDFSSFANDPATLSHGESVKIDLVKTTCGGKVRYFDNMMNIGFDCSVVYETEKIRAGGVIKGSAAYMAGVAKVLGAKKPIHPTITLSGCVDTATGEPIDDVTFSKELLLTACANGKLCGGGFKAAPLAKLTDGLMDVLVISNISRVKFVSLVKDYHDGTFINEKGQLKPRFKDVITYVKCRKMEISGIERFCLDGEIFSVPAGEPLVAEIVPAAINFRAI